MIDSRRKLYDPYSMTIELSQEQESALQKLIEAGHYETPQDFIDEALSDAYSQTEAFKEMVRKKIAASNEDIAAGRVVTVTKENVHDILRQHRAGTLKPR